eukprot:TRINITY_DN3701_c0_g1_i2.p1 TRINITY_DN3701_c0_g1~~TRINITY_DN3701_c0_g1_i2.p1  ORF type:complete len:153 (-),score=12.21 TRINITY_DN3701_c0_g1_i2:187-645(-)
MPMASPSFLIQIFSLPSADFRLLRPALVEWLPVIASALSPLLHCHLSKICISSPEISLHPCTSFLSPLPSLPLTILPCPFLPCCVFPKPKCHSSCPIPHSFAVRALTHTEALASNTSPALTHTFMVDDGRQLPDLALVPPVSYISHREQHHH